MIGSRVRSVMKTMSSGRIRAAIIVDSNEVDHHYFEKGEDQKAHEWAGAAKKRAEDEVYQNAKG
jgi:hypothetical protein